MYFFQSLKVQIVVDFLASVVEMSKVYLFQDYSLLHQSGLAAPIFLVLLCSRSLCCQYWGPICLLQLYDLIIKLFPNLGELLELQLLV